MRREQSSVRLAHRPPRRSRTRSQEKRLPCGLLGCPRVRTLSGPSGRRLFTRSPGVPIQAPRHFGRAADGTRRSYRVYPTGQEGVLGPQARSGSREPGPPDGFDATCFAPNRAARSAGCQSGLGDRCPSRTRGPGVVRVGARLPPGTSPVVGGFVLPSREVGSGDSGHPR